jgi:sporulation protein YlmC with PRC-barrel domain
MALYGNLRNYQFMKETDDIRGATIYGANDEKLGKIDDIIFDHSNGDLRYIVVDAGGWLSTRKFLVPAGEITVREEGDEDFHVNMTKEQIERLPEYKEESLEADDQWSDYERSYQGALTDGPVLHREGSSHMITPPPDGKATTLDPESNRKSMERAIHTDPKSIARDLPRFGATSTSDDSTETANLVANVDRNPVKVDNEYNGVDASLPREDQQEEPVTMSRSEFLKEGTLRSEYDAPMDVADERELDNSNGSVLDSVKASMAGISGDAPDGGNRFRAFQERLRHEREEIMRRREQERKNKAA